MAIKRGSGERVTLSAIRDAYFDGEYEVCLTMCETLSQRDAKGAAETVLLRARCLIQLDRGDQAIESLRGLRLADDQHDEYLIGRMLMSAAYVGLGKYDEGLKIAREAYDGIGTAHPTVRSEVTTNLAITHYRNGEYGKASRLLDAIPESEDIVYVRALQFRGGVAWANCDYAGSLELFRDALARLDRCRHHDRFTEAKLLFSLAYLCAELPRLDLWADLSTRIERFDWSVSGVATWRYLIALASSFITELLGDLGAATSCAGKAEEVALDQASLIAAWCRLAACLGRNGERHGHKFFTEKAIRLYQTMPRDSRLREQWSLSLVIAEEVLHSDSPLFASSLVTYYSEVIAPLLGGIGAEARSFESRYALIQGHLEEHRGNRGRALEAYRRAFEMGRSTGLRRSAAIVAYRLFVLTGEQQYEMFIKGALRDVSETYWVKAKLARSRTEARLTARQIEIVRLVAQGLTDKEIAAARGVSYARARNVVAEIRALLGVRSRSELASVAAARGLLRTT